MRAYEELVARLIRDLPGAVRPVPASSHHLTLVFLGEVPESLADDCVSALEVVRDSCRFPYTLGPPRVLKGRGRPRLVKVDVLDNAHLVAEVQSSLVAAVGRHLPSIDTRPKPAHATIARCRRNLSRSRSRQLEGTLERLLDQPLPGADEFSSAHLVRSSLTRDGPIYESLSEVELSGS